MTINYGNYFDAPEFEEADKFRVLIKQYDTYKGKFVTLEQSEIYDSEQEAQIIYMENLEQYADEFDDGIYYLELWCGSEDDENGFIPLDKPEQVIKFKISKKVEKL